MASGLNDGFVTPGEIIPNGFLIPVSSMTEPLLMTKILETRNRLPLQCLHRQDKTFPLRILPTASRTLREKKVLHRYQICLSCQQSAGCRARISH